jgi:Zn-dependent alcohol dehydrogenase
VLDLDERKVEQARMFGATDASTRPFDFVFDAVGRRETFELGLSLLASGGTFVLIGLSPAGERAEVDLPGLFGKRARILVSHGGDHVARDDFPKLAAWALDGTLDLAGMVSQVAPLAEWQAALTAMQNGDVIRTVLVP